MRTLLALLSALALATAGAASPGHRIGGGTDRPQICPAGYATKTFETRAFTTSNVDMAKTAAKGFQWYPWNFLSGFQSGDTATLNADGTISATGVSGPNGGVTSAATTSSSPFFVGTAFGGGLCLQAEVSFDPGAADTTAGWPSFWGMAIEHLLQKGGSQWPGQATGFEHYIETDFLEYYKLGPPQYLGSMIDWYGSYKGTCAPAGFCSIASSVANTPNIIQPLTDWKNVWHRIGAVWIPATSTTSGSMQYFFDDQPLGPAWTWTQCPSSFSPPPASPYTYCVLDQQHLVLLFGSNTTAINVRSVVVWQATAANNLTN